MSLKGVSDAQVNLGTETATVEYDSTKLKLTDIEKVVTDAGYEVINEDRGCIYIKHYGYF